jgi:hypothetical protein
LLDAVAGGSAASALASAVAQLISSEHGANGAFGGVKPSADAACL